MSIIPNDAGSPVASRLFHRPDRTQPKLGGVFGKLVEAKPQLEWVRVGDLNIDHNYQRDNISQSWVQEIAENFDDDLFGVLYVNMREDGSLWCYDGQHRMLAVCERLGPDTLVPAFVTFGKTAEEEAYLFQAMQSHRRPIRPLERFKAQLFYKAPAALDIDAIVEAAGFHIGDPGLGGRGLSCLGTIEALYYPRNSGPNEKRVTRRMYYEQDPDTYGDDWVGRDRLIWVLQTIALAWEYREIMPGAILENLGVLHTAQKHMKRPIDQQRLAEVLRFRSPRGWSVRKSEKQIPLWAVIAADYNRGLQGGRRIPTAIVRAERQQGTEVEESVTDTLGSASGGNTNALRSSEPTITR